jgi:peptide deformylase
VPAQHDVSEDGRRLNPDIPMPLILVNPVVTATQGEQSGQEGCLSFPEIYVTIRRPAEATVVFQDLENRKRTVRARGLVARAVLHEVDHLNAVLLVDRMSAVQKVAVAGKLRRLKKRSARMGR